ncbi:MAG TPA: hypothetical protein VFA20_13455 [Myxococcaceae bacterium]|nr:hypothetical protein [Myxococcaceae bacterium]
MGFLEWASRRQEPRWRVALRSFALGGAGGLLAGLYFAARGRDSASGRLRRKMDEERLARERAERRAAEAEHLALHALDRERELAERLHDAELRLQGGAERKKER